MSVLAKVVVTPRRGVLDPQGKAVAQSLHSLGFSEVGDVRVGRYLEVEIDDDDLDRADGKVRRMCEQLLANGVIEDFRFELVEAEPAR